MSERPGKDEYVNGFLEAARERWGNEEVQRIRSALERTAEAAWLVDAFGLGPEDEPSRPSGQR
jgi:hypothetical protein